MSVIMSDKTLRSYHRCYVNRIWFYVMSCSNYNKKSDVNWTGSCTHKAYFSDDDDDDNEEHVS
jgi:hypothetical protein